MIVRYYGSEYSPQLFQKKGLRAWYILLLARIVAWLERKIEWHVMLFQLKHTDAEPGTAARLKRVFRKETIERRRRAADINPDEPEPRYRSRKNSVPEETAMSYREQRTMRTADFFARYIDVGRAGPFRYGKAQRIANPNGDCIERVPPNDPNWRPDHDEGRTA